MNDDLVLRCPRHPTYDGETEMPAMTSYTQHCRSCARLHKIRSLVRESKAAETSIWRQVLMASAEMEAMPASRREALRRAVAG